MKCWHPIALSDGRVVPCSRCIACLERRRDEWSFRIKQELKTAKTAYFLTLTYDDDHLQYNSNGEATIEKSTLQKYFKRVRKHTKSLRYFACGEYGTKTNRPHYHAIVFDSTPLALASEWHDCKRKNKSPLGHIRFDPVNDATIHYVAGYIINKNGKTDPMTGKVNKSWTVNDIKPFALMSKGLGKIYLKNATKYHKSNFTLTTIQKGGIKGHLPRYYKDKIFDSEEKSELRRILELRENEELYDEFEQKKYYKKLMVERQQTKKQKL